MTGTNGDAKPPRVRARESVRALTAYSEEAPIGLNLSNNTNLFGPNPALARALADARPEAFREYPTLGSEPLRDALARFHDVPAECIITGNGSNDLIDLITRAFTSPGDAVAFHPPTFGMIPHFARAHDARPVPVPLTPEDAWALPADALVDADAGLTFVVSPNNPTGNAFPRAHVLDVVDRARGLVVADEAYGEFAPDRSLLKDAPERDGLVVLRTFSKAFGLAGLRAGYAVASPDVAGELAKIRGPFRLNAFSELACVRALEETEYLERVVAEVAVERERVSALLRARGFRVFPSDANFILFEPDRDARALAEKLAARNVHVRAFSGDMGKYLRTTVGPAAVTDEFEAALDAALKEVDA